MNADLFINGKDYIIESEKNGSEADVNWIFHVDSSGPSTAVTLVFPSLGQYRVKIDPTESEYFNSFKINNSRLQKIERWGTASWSTMQSAFVMNPNLKVTASDIPYFSNCTSFEESK